MSSLKVEMGDKSVVCAEGRDDVEVWIIVPGSAKEMLFRRRTIRVHSPFVIQIY